MTVILSPIGIRKYRLASHIDSVLVGETQYGSGQLRFEVFRTIAEICFGSTHMGCIGHRVFTTFRKAVHIGRKFSSLFFIQSAAHSIHYIKCCLYNNIPLCRIVGTDRQACIEPPYLKNQKPNT